MAKKLITGKQGLPKPTEAELGILRVLWDLGPTTVRHVHEVLTERAQTGYTTVLKLLQIMHQKGLVQRDDSNRAHIYVPTLSKETTQQLMLGDFLSRVFEGSSSALVMQALDSGAKNSREELKRIREMLDELESQ